MICRSDVLFLVSRPRSWYGDKSFTLRLMTLSTSEISSIPSRIRSWLIFTHSKGTLLAWPILIHTRYNKKWLPQRLAAHHELYDRGSVSGRNRNPYMIWPHLHLHEYVG